MPFLAFLRRVIAADLDDRGAPLLGQHWRSRSKKPLDADQNA
jgi:hypothetical protein